MERSLMPKRVLIEDSTLREGEQTPGVAFTEAQKRAIIEALRRVGIAHIEVGTPVMAAGEFETLRRLAREYEDLTLIGWNRGVRSDLDKSIEAGLRALHVGLPSSSIHIEQKFGRDPSWVIDTATDLIDYARQRGAEFISVSAEDMGRADLAFLQRYALAIQEAGATRMRLSDTVGCLRPQRTREIIEALKQKVDLDLQVHMHNDLNLALANVLAGVEGGATQVHVTVNGLGERAGLASLHQVAIALQVVLGVDTGIDLKHLGRLTELVAKCTGLPIAHNEPVLGDHVFMHESGIHVDGVLKVKESFESFSPEMVGREHQFVLGKHSGSRAVEFLLEQEGIELGRDEARDLLPLLRDLAPLLGGTVEPRVLATLARHRGRG